MLSLIIGRRRGGILCKSSLDTLIYFAIMQTPHVAAWTFENGKNPQNETRQPKGSRVFAFVSCAMQKLPNNAAH